MYSGTEGYILLFSKSIQCRYNTSINSLKNAEKNLKVGSYFQSAVGFELYLNSMSIVAKSDVECSKHAKYNLYQNKYYALEGAQEAYIKSGMTGGKFMENLIRTGNEANSVVRALKREYGID